MSELRERMIAEMVYRNYSERTIELYVRHVAQLAKHYNRCPSKLSREIACADLEFKSITETGFEATETGIYRMTLLPGANTMSVMSSTHPVLISGEESPIHLHTAIGTFFFWVPSGTQIFGVRVSGVGVGEAVRAALLNPSGEIVEEVDNATTHQFDVNLPVPTQGEAWGIRLLKPTQIVLDDQYIDLRGIPPLLAGDKGVLLKPEAAPAFVPVERTESGPQGEFLLNGKPFLPKVSTRPGA